MKLAPNPFNKGSQECLDKLFHLLHKTGKRKAVSHVTSEGRVAVMAKCGPPSQTDVIFVASDALVERIYVEDLIVKRNATDMSYPCVFDFFFFFEPRR